MSNQPLNLAGCIRSIPDFPKPGILFRDITTLLADKDALDQAVNALAQPFEDKKIDYVAAVEARGFIFGAPVAQKLNAGFIPIRKPGKLPHKTESMTYDLEYGSDTIEVHADGAPPDSNVLMVDDLLATGGTMAAACKLIEKLNANITAVAFLVELADLAGREKLKDYPLHVVVSF